jgi:hypothetical protein
MGGCYPKMSTLPPEHLNKIINIQNQLDFIKHQNLPNTKKIWQHHKKCISAKHRFYVVYYGRVVFIGFPDDWLEFKSVIIKIQTGKSANKFPRPLLLLFKQISCGDLSTGTLLLISDVERVRWVGWQYNTYYGPADGLILMFAINQFTALLCEYYCAKNKETCVENLEFADYFEPFIYD